MTVERNNLRKTIVNGGHHTDIYTCSVFYHTLPLWLAKMGKIRKIFKNR